MRVRVCSSSSLPNGGVIGVSVRPRYIVEKIQIPARHLASSKACCVAGLRDRAGDLTYSSYGPFSTYTRKVMMMMMMVDVLVTKRPHDRSK